MRSRTIRIGTRGSQLALWQARHVQSLLAVHHPGREFPIEIIKTQGDRIQDRALYRVEDKGFFTKELEDALLDERIDLAVHSLKDLPTELPEALVIAAIPAREDPHDVWLARDGSSLADAPAGARVGTSSLRRQAQLRALRPDLVPVDLRGNVPTRLQKLEEGVYHAIVLARAGLHRLGLLPPQAQVLPFEQILPAPGQGALGVEVRAVDEKTRQIVGSLDDTAARLEVTAERALLHALQGGCLVPVGAHARWAGGSLELAGVVAALSGEPLLRSSATMAVSSEEEARDLGARVASELISAGAGPLLDEVRGSVRKQGPPPELRP